MKDVKKYMNELENEFFLGMDFLAQAIIIVIMIVTLPFWLPIRLVTKNSKR